MAIVIPSSHIYGLTNNKVKDNDIGKVEFQVTNPQLVQNDNSVVYSTTTSIGFSLGDKIEDKQSAPYYLHTLNALVSIEPIYFNGTITFPDKTNDIYISNVNASDIKYSINYIKEVYKYNTRQTTPTISAWTSELISSEEITGVLSSADLNVSLKDSETTENSVVEIDVEAKITEINNLDTADIRHTQNEYRVELKILVGAETYRLYWQEFYRNDPEMWDGTLDVRVGQKIRYIPRTLTISFYGETISLDLNKTSTHSSGDSQPIYSHNTNELIQDSAKVLDSSNENGESQPVADFISSGILQNYRNGKETATVLCDIGDYYEYNENGETTTAYLRKSANFNSKWVNVTFVTAQLASDIILTVAEPDGSDIPVSVTYIQNNGEQNTVDIVLPSGQTKYRHKIVDYTTETLVKEIVNYTVSVPMTFDMYDKIIPMVYTSGGVDKPMSAYADGTPKVFQVLSNKVYYDGAVWQELKIQEV